MFLYVFNSGQLRACLAPFLLYTEFWQKSLIYPTCILTPFPFDVYLSRNFVTTFSFEKARIMGLSGLKEYWSVTDGWTDRRTNGQKLLVWSY